jgi:fatty acid desaturase
MVSAAQWQTWDNEKQQTTTILTLVLIQLFIGALNFALSYYSFRFCINVSPYLLIFFGHLMSENSHETLVHLDFEAESMSNSIRNWSFLLIIIVTTTISGV